MFSDNNFLTLNLDKLFEGIPEAAEMFPNQNASDDGTEEGASQRRSNNYPIKILKDHTSVNPAHELSITSQYRGKRP